MTQNLRWPWILAVLLGGWLLYLLTPILSPFLLAMLLAYLGDPLVDRLQRLKLSRSTAVILVFAAFSLLLLLLLLVLVPLLGRQLVRLYEVTPQVLDWLQQRALPWVQVQLGLPEGFWRLDQVKKALSGHVGQTGDILGLLLGQASASGRALLGWLTDVLLVPVVGFYLLRDWDRLVVKVRALLPRRLEPLLVRLAGECHAVLGAFIRGQLLVMLALGLIYASGLSIVGLDLGLLVGLLAGLASIVPYMGFIIGSSAAVIAAIFQHGGMELYPLLGVALVFGLGQLLEGMLLTPMLVGDRIGLHPVAVIFAILAGGQLFGFVGILLALPAAAVIMVLLRHANDLYKLSDLYREPATAPEPPREPE
ncbi:AI-2E family transporter [Pseudomonas sp. N040]|uniref:AI-2E family transporter n=1 Tax=Pseudomonas sp. N040 TaxID=2785325 RepID=UPI0018A3128A|nr:AI-2E family transporter [Pseudomonas sp. N040]MBF7729390.1 AI-2E family transporter [Pseudomonas sp. N040]MBW7013030.1 AI-2E family transporter [Pseudomonas sp. N040]